MKIRLLKLKIIATLIALTTLAGACGSKQNLNEDTGNASGNNNTGGNNNSSAANEGNHATEPREPAGTAYPGSDSSATGTNSASVHQ